MRLGQAFAAAAVVGWSKAAVATPAVPMVTQPAAAPVAPVAKPFAVQTTTCTADFKGPPFIFNQSQFAPPDNVVEVDMSDTACAGTLFMMASLDQTHWKSMKNGFGDHRERARQPRQPRQRLYRGS